MNFKVALVTPYVFLKDDYVFSPHRGLDDLLRTNFKKHLLRRPNLSLLTLASYLDDRYEITYLDEQYADIDFEKEYDIVAISIMTPNAYRGYEIGDKFRKKGSHVIIGGIHATLIPQEAKEHADTVIAGEGEEAWQKFLKDFHAGEAKPYYYGTGNMELDESPLPRYDLLPREFYYSSLFKKEVYSYQFSRGCPHRCTFCSSSKAYGPRYRTKSVEHYLTEIDQARERTAGDFLLFFADDDVTIKKAVAKPLLERMAEDHPTPWIGCADIAISNDNDLMEKITKSGCKGLIMGFESLNEHSLMEVDPFKARYFKSYDDAVKRMIDHGIPLFASFIVGFDSDQKDCFEKIYNFITRHKIPMSSLSLLTPFPGTSIYEQYKREGRLFYENFWDKCTGAYPLFKHPNLSSEDLMEGAYKVMMQLNRDQMQRNVRL
ncbi:MAG: radical SAM protein [bacterium]